MPNIYRAAVDLLCLGFIGASAGRDDDDDMRTSFDGGLRVFVFVTENNLFTSCRTCKRDAPQHGAKDKPIYSHIFTVSTGTGSKFNNNRIVTRIFQCVPPNPS